MEPRKILGVSESANLEEIQRAYRKAVSKHHPDMGGDAWAFQQVNEAYEALVAQMERTKTNRSTLPKSSNAKTRPNQTEPTRSKRSDSRTPNSRKGRAPEGSESSARQPKGFQSSTNSRSESEQRGGRSPAGQKKATSGKTNRGRSANNKTKTDGSSFDWWNLFSGELPLQNETSMFILVNVLDIFMTRLLLAYGAIEANPIANFFLRLWGFNGMIVFKLLIVSFVCLIAQVVATKRKATGRGLLIAGTLLVAAVVAYSVWLYLNKIAR